MSALQNHDGVLLLYRPALFRTLTQDSRMCYAPCCPQLGMV
jgi:hypothetical protein